jgi:hypothetical protein
MDLAAALFSAIAAASLACWIAQRTTRRASALAAAGLAGEGAPVPERRLHLLPALNAGLERLGRKVSPRPAREIGRLLDESGSAWTPHYL